MSTAVERIAAWAAELSLTDVPVTVVETCRAQRRSVVAAVAASSTDRAAQRVLAGLDSWAADGPVPFPATDRTGRADDAIYAATALSMALDFDDYVCFAHTGHSAVLVPLLLAVETTSSGPEQLVAQIAANEVQARLGGACLVGPLNGQLWSFVHAAGAALAAGRLLDLDTEHMAHALALALYQAPRPTMPGFMAPDSKLLTASDPTLAGVRAARLAAAGVTGPLDVLEHPQGFLEAFSYAPLRAMFRGLGRGWATRTLSIKRYPGCAYVDTIVDALLELGPPPASEVDQVIVEASMVTYEMDALSRGYATGAGPTPVTVNFSVPWNVAITLLAGELSPVQTREDWLAEHHAALAGTVRRVSLRHDWSLTLRAATAMAPLLPPRAVVAGVGRRRLLRALRRTRHERAGPGGTPAASIELLRAIWQARGAGRRRRPTDAPTWAADAQLWKDDALEEFAMTFPARVRVRLRSGRELATEIDVPLGGAGNRMSTPGDAAREKLAQWGRSVWGEQRTDAIDEAIDHDADNLGTLMGATI